MLDELAWAWLGIEMAGVLVFELMIYGRCSGFDDVMVW
jgi:hypothetical protein